MNKILMLSLLLTSTVLHASCGDLEIKIINDSSHNCTFKNILMYYGVLPESSVPPIIPAKESSPIFFASQDKMGVGVLLTYNCDDEIVKFYSGQNYCGFFGAGQVGGQPHDSSTLNVSYETKMGSSSEGRPGQIIWRIS